MASKKEIWMAIDQNPRYEISNKKRVRNSETRKVLVTDRHNAVTLSDYGYRQHLSINTLFNQAF